MSEKDFNRRLLLSRLIPFPVGVLAGTVAWTALLHWLTVAVILSAVVAVLVFLYANLNVRLLISIVQDIEDDVRDLKRWKP